MRQRVLVFTVVIWVILAIGPLSGMVGARALPAPAVSDNLLENGDFEGAFSYRHDPYTGVWAGELEVADGWELWYNNDQSCPDYDPNCNPLSYNRRPEYKPEQGTARVRSGAKAHKFFTTYGTHEAGLYQIVEVEPGSWVRFSAWVWAWSSQKDIPAHSFQDGSYASSLGIDPTGGSDWTSDDIIWAEPVVKHDQWVHLTLDAYTASGKLSVWIRGTQTRPVKHNDSYWDDAELVVLGSPPAPTATPTATSTYAPTPAATPTGHIPSECESWQTLWLDDFDAGLTEGWDYDPAQGTVAIEGGALWLRNGVGSAEAFPIAWVDRAWPLIADVKLSFRFAFAAPTAYGSTIGVGSATYDGERSLAYSPDPYGIEDIVSIQQRALTYTVKLLGQTVWTGTPGDANWHALELERRETTFILKIDGVERGRGVSYWRPRSLYLGNPVIVWDTGRWSEVAIDDVKLEQCEVRTLLLPLIVREHIWPAPTVPPMPTATATATPTGAANDTLPAPPLLPLLMNRGEAVTGRE